MASETKGKTSQRERHRKRDGKENRIKARKRKRGGGGNKSVVGGGGWFEK